MSCYSIFWMGDEVLYKVLATRPLIILGAAGIALAAYTCFPQTARAPQKPAAERPYNPRINRDRSQIDVSSLSRIARYGLTDQENKIIEDVRGACERGGFGRPTVVNISYSGQEKNIDLLPPDEADQQTEPIKGFLEDSQEYFESDLLPRADLEVSVPRTLQEIYDCRLQPFETDSRVFVYLVGNIRHNFGASVSFSTDKGFVNQKPVVIELTEFLYPGLDFIPIKTTVSRTVRQFRGPIICSTKLDGKKESLAAAIQAPVIGVLCAKISPYTADLILEDMSSGTTPEAAEDRQTLRAERLAHMLAAAWFSQGYGLGSDNPYIFGRHDLVTEREARRLIEETRSGDRGPILQAVQRFRDDPDFLVD